MMYIKCLIEYGPGDVSPPPTGVRIREVQSLVWLPDLLSRTISSGNLFFEFKNYENNFLVFLPTRFLKGLLSLLLSG